MECGEQGEPPGRGQNHWNRQGWGWQGDLSSEHTPPTANCFINALEKGIDQNRWGF